MLTKVTLYVDPHQLIRDQCDPAVIEYRGQCGGGFVVKWKMVGQDVKINSVGGATPIAMIVLLEIPIQAIIMMVAISIFVLLVYVTRKKLLSIIVREGEITPVQSVIPFSNLSNNLRFNHSLVERPGN